MNQNIQNPDDFSRAQTPPQKNWLPVWLIVLGVLFAVFVFLAIAIYLSLAFVVPQAIDNRSAIAKRSRVEAEVRMISQSLEQFFIDNNQYPIPGEDFTINSASLVKEMGGVTQIHKLTTPIAYMSSLPFDPFFQNNQGFYKYQSDGKAWYILSSRGPDGDFENYDIEMLKKDAASLNQFRYDTSNGVNSGGDIFRIGP